MIAIETQSGIAEELSDPSGVVIERVGLDTRAAGFLTDAPDWSVVQPQTAAPSEPAPLVRDLEGVGYVARPADPGEPADAALVLAESLLATARATVETPSSQGDRTETLMQRVVATFDRRATQFTSWTPSTPLPSQVVLLVAGLALACLTLLAAFTLSTFEEESVRVAAPGAYEQQAELGEAGAITVGGRLAQQSTPQAESAAPASFPAEPLPIPTDLLTDLEAAGDLPLDVELARLLDAIQYGFGSESVQLEPTLRSYVYRMASRFEFNPGTFRIAVTAPKAELAEARSAVLGQLFDGAVASGKLKFASGLGPHALSLITD